MGIFLASTSSRQQREVSMQIIMRLLIFWIFIFIIGCQAKAVDPETPLDSTSMPVTPPDQGGTTQMSPSIPTPADAGLQELIEKAKADLAQRLSVPANKIMLVEATSVVWPDASLGCPQEGMVYAQVLTPGYLIRLMYKNQQFEYHASRGIEVIYCENPTPPVPGTPGDI